MAICRGLSKAVAHGWVQCINLVTYATGKRSYRYAIGRKGVMPKGENIGVMLNFCPFCGAPQNHGDLEEDEATAIDCHAWRLAQGLPIPEKDEVPA